MLEITGENINELNDSDLRVLIGLLCEADLSAIGLPTASVTMGGSQDAADGGIDVLVSTTNSVNPDGFIPRSNTGFQVKKSKMPRGKIIQEMKPKGLLRESILELIKNKGSYIMVSSSESLSDSVLKERRNALRDALVDIPNATNLNTDFYDQARIASWVRSHPSMILWVRNEINKPVHGWKAYDNWAQCPKGIEEEYLLDEEIRIFSGLRANSSGFSGINGIQEIRKILFNPCSAVRLTGLSGVGKTRLVQALFDERIGENPLPKSNAFYTDISLSPLPIPVHFSEELVSLNKPGILIVDNCPPDMHRALSIICSNGMSQIRLITVEYDISEDQPETTDCFRIEACSINLIKKIMLIRFPLFDHTIIERIADFSGGNARIAIYLGNKVRKGENISHLNDVDLFNRLFYQRNFLNPELLFTAEIFSLVYSFSIVPGEKTRSELENFSLLSELSVKTLRKNISELRKRELIQERSIWRAVLPHPLANRLAKVALEKIGIDEICTLFEQKENFRLLSSFARRLSYLHGDPNAILIAKRWLSKDGLLGDLMRVNPQGMEYFKFIAPIDPELTLSAIEIGAAQDQTGLYLTRSNKNFSPITQILYSIAYDSALFERSINLLCKFAISESSTENNNSIRGILKSLFQLLISGTHASYEQKSTIISKLLKHNELSHRELGLELLDASLRTGSFTGHHINNFGAHIRDNGFKPRTNEDKILWYTSFLRLIITEISTNSILKEKLKSIVAKNFRGLWIYSGVFDLLENVVSEILKFGYWADGWIAVKQTLNFDGKRMKPKIKSQLLKIGSLLEPKRLADKVRAFALGSDTDTIYLIDEEDGSSGRDAMSKVEQLTRLLGQELSLNEEVLNELLNEILSTDGYTLYPLGQGVADVNKCPYDFWIKLKNQLRLISPENRIFSFLGGFIETLSNTSSEIANTILDEAIEDEIFAHVFPFLQTSAGVNERGSARIIQSLEKNIANAYAYRYLGWGRKHASIPDDLFIMIVQKLSSKPKGQLIAIEILNMRILSIRDRKNQISESILKLGRELILNFDFTQDIRNIDYVDYELGNIIESCFAGNNVIDESKGLITKISNLLINYKVIKTNLTHVLEALSDTQPILFLNEFISDPEKSNFIVERWFPEDIGDKKSIISQIEDEVLFQWCTFIPSIRFELLASAIRPFEIIRDEYVWSPLAMRMILDSPRPLAILQEFSRVFSPSSWSGSKASIIKKRMNLLEWLKFQGGVIKEWAIQKEIHLEVEIKEAIEYDEVRNRPREDRFE